MVNLIYDRTAEDVANGTAKGYYRYTDLNRVQAAVVYIRDRFLAAGYDTIPAPSFRTWAENDVPRRNRLNAYLAAVRSLDVVPGFGNAESVPNTPDNLTWQGANAIEEFLTLTDAAVDSIESAWYYCGEVFAGEVDE
jgi:hypothetical protein